VGGQHHAPAAFTPSKDPEKKEEKRKMWGKKLHW
jgi:hypothetical protein